MPDKLDSFTIKMIRTEAKSAISEDKENILQTIRTTGLDMVENITGEMHRHFAKKTDLLEWKLENRDLMDKLIDKAILSCEKRNKCDEKKNQADPPSGERAIVEPSSLITGKGVAKLSTAITLLGGAIWGFLEIVKNWGN